MKHLSDSRFAAFVGIDWADAKHDVCLRAADSDNDEYAVTRHTPEAIQDWALGLQRRFNGQPIAVCLELNKGPLVAALRQYDWIVRFPVNPKSLAKYREAFASSGAKDDPSDARLQLDLLIKHPERLKALEPLSVFTHMEPFRFHLNGTRVFSP
jgi:hypothetical protein